MVLLEKLKQALSGLGHSSQEEQLTSQLVDVLLDRIDPRLKNVPGYQHQLAPVVGQIQRVIEEFLPRLPQPVALSKAEYASSPELKLIVPSPEALHEALVHSQALKEWCKAQPEACDCYGLLGAHFEQYQKLGTAIENDIIMRDVLQQALRFNSPRLMCLSAELGLLEDKVRQRTLDGYCQQAIRQKSQSAAKAQQLKSEQSLLKAQLKLREKGHSSFANDLEGQQHASMSREELEQALEQIHDQLLALGVAPGQSIEHQLSLVAQILSTPRQFIDFTAHNFRVDLNGILVSANDPAGEDVRWQTLVIDQSKEYALLPVMIPAAELAREGLFTPLQIATQGKL